MKGRTMKDEECRVELYQCRTKVKNIKNVK